MKQFFTPSGRLVKHVGLYGRVSSKKQEDNTSLANQIEKETAFALEHGFEIVETKTETITGASRWGARTGFNTYLALAEKGLLDGVIVDVPDRLGRGRALATLLDRAYKHDLAVIFANGQEMDDTTLGVDIIKSGAEREDIGRRTREGRLKTIRQGGIVFSRAPYGYRILRTFDPHTGEKIGARVEFEPEEIQHVVMMYHWLVVERKTLHGIRLRLFENEVLPPSLKDRYGTWDNVPEGVSKMWCRSGLKNTLSNSAYVGKWYYNKVETKRVEGTDRMKQVRRGTRDESEWVSIEIPVAIPQETFEQAQAILRKNKQQQIGRPPSKYQYLLKGLLFCPCGWRMIGVTYNSGNGAYRCKRDVASVERACDAPRLNQEIAESLVWDYVSLMLAEPQRLLDEYEARQAEVQKQNTILLERADNLQTNISKGKVKLNRFLDLYGDGELDKEIYKRKKAEVEAEIKDLELEFVQVQSLLQQDHLTEQDKLEFIDFCRNAWAVLDNPTFEQRRQTLLKLNVKVSFLPDEEGLKIEGTFPTGQALLVEAYEPDWMERGFESFPSDFHKELSSTRGRDVQPW